MSSTTQNASLVHRTPVFYGWVVWLVAALGLIATSPGQSFTVSLFYDFFIEDFGISRTTVATMYGLGTFLASLSLTWVGAQVDRFGNRRATVVISGLFVVVLLGMSLVTGPLTLFFGFFAIRGLGQGSLGLASTTVVAQWFKAGRGRVSALLFVGMSLWQAFYVPWLQRTLAIYDWRTVWIILALVVVLPVIPITWVLMRDKPEDHGLLPDDGRIAAAQKFTESEYNYTLGQAMRTPIFWVYVAGRFLPPAWVTGLVIHQISIFAELGYDENVATETFAMFVLMTAGVSLASGWLVDNMRPGIVFTITLLGLAGACIFATTMTSPLLLMMYAIALAITMGVGPVFDGAVWANLYGRQYLGSIRGFVNTTLVAGTAAGPILFALSFDYLGGYDPVLWLGAGLCFVPAVLGLIVPTPDA